MRKNQVSDPIRHPAFYAWLSKLRDRGSKSLLKTPSINTRTKANKIKPLGRDRNRSWRKNKVNKQTPSSGASVREEAKYEGGQNAGYEKTLACTSGWSFQKVQCERTPF